MRDLLKFSISNRMFEIKFYFLPLICSLVLSALIQNSTQAQINASYDSKASFQKNERSVAETDIYEVAVKKQVDFSLVVDDKMILDVEKRSIQPEHLQKILTLVRIEADVVDLNRDDGFNRGLFFEMPDGTPITIGFPRNGLQIGRPFLIVTLSDEAIVQLSEDGTISLINEDEEIRATGIIEIIECQLAATAKMIDAIDQCNLDLSSFDVICVLEAVIQSSIDFSECILANLSQ